MTNRKQIEVRRYHCPEITNDNYQRLEKAIGHLAGVETPGIVIPTQTISLYFQPELISETQLLQILLAAGFPLEPIPSQTLN